ncbi:MAG: hypothetical protein E7167_03730 [Firmicutes bacterium]|nr:hypothetical protein [Bacillota bacterium]
MKNKLISFLFVGYLIFFALLHIIIKDDEISSTERRKLASFPTLELTSDYVTKVEKYLLDHFPYRDEYRNVKSFYNFNILGRLENNGITIKNNSIYKTEYPTSLKSIDNFINKTEKIKKLFENSKFYLMVIPDKNYYLTEGDFLHLDYNLIYDELNKLNMINIDLRNILNLEDYYRTDTHWKQQNLDKVVNKMSEKMTFPYEKDNYIINKYSDFYGVYYGQGAKKIIPDELIYLTNDIISNAKVKYLENPELSKVYNDKKLTSLDAYEVYLDGASSYIEIVNSNIQEEKELIIFRDSFGSSITPLLIKYYSKITVVDNRYISSENFMNLLKRENQDVLFIYSTLIVNNSSTLKG